MKFLQKIEVDFFVLVYRPPLNTMTSSTNNEKYLPEPAWLNITQFLIPKKTPLPLFPHPTAWALTESGLNFHGNKGFFHSDDRFKAGHLDGDVYQWRIFEKELAWTEKDGFGDAIADKTIEHLQIILGEHNGFDS